MLHRINLRHSWEPAKTEYARAMAERDFLRAQLEALERQHNELLQVLREALDVVREARCETEDRLARLYRERDIQRGLKAERDPMAPLQ